MNGVEFEVVEVESHGVKVSVLDSVEPVVDPRHLHVSIAQALTLDLDIALVQFERFAAGVSKSDEILVLGCGIGGIQR